MYRTVFTPTETDNVIPFNIPREWYGQEIEVLVFPVKNEKKTNSTKISASEISILPFSAGLWSDYDIDDRKLRSKAWGTHKRTVQ